ncbi:MAG: NUDIX hydrolase [Aliidongia sp.]|jgi:8-oxo-dGTP diphosphatase
MNRNYPTQPITGILALVRRGDRFLLVRRANPPNQGYWGFPGGVQELGETIQEAAYRELAEETGVRATAPRIFTAIDAIDRDEAGRCRHHYTLIVVLFDWLSGEGEAADDAEALGWFRLQDIETLPALPAVGSLILQVLDSPA